MSSTTNVQNLITTVFRPLYTYDSTSNVFVPRVEMSNVDTYIGNEVFVIRAQVGDSNNNMYVGVGAGNPYTNTTSGNTDLMAIGVGAGASTNNITDSIYLGSNAGANANLSDNVIAIGVSAKVGGSRNIYLGNSTGNVGTNNVFIGHNIQPATVVNNSLNINNLVYGDFSARWIGVGNPNRTSSTEPINLDVSGSVYVSRKMGIQMLPNNTLNVNGSTQSTGGLYSFSGSNAVGASSALTIGTTGNGAATTQLGNVLISVQDATTTGANYETGLYFCANAGAAPTKMTSNLSNGYAHISFSGSNIQISNSDSGSHVLSWSITYFPLTP